MTRHINLRDDDDTAFGGVSLQLGTLCLCVIVASETCHVDNLVELWISIRLKPEALVVCQVPMEDVDLEAREQVNLFL